MELHLAPIRTPSTPIYQSSATGWQIFGNFAALSLGRDKLNQLLPWSYISLINVIYLRGLLDKQVTIVLSDPFPLRPRRPGAQPQGRRPLCVRRQVQHARCLLVDHSHCYIVFTSSIFHASTSYSHCLHIVFLQRCISTQEEHEPEWYTAHMMHSHSVIDSRHRHPWSFLITN